MKGLIFVLGFTSLTALSSLFNHPALAEPLKGCGENDPNPTPFLLSSNVRRVTIPQSNSTSAPQDQPISIELAPGHGVNISFIPTGEVIEKVWLDNPSFVTLDVDGCLSGLGERECEQNGATILHLRRINQLDIPGLSKTDSTLLTVVTRSSQGRQLYLFEIVQAPETSFSVVELVRVTEAPDLFLINAIERGVQRALAQNFLNRDSPLNRRLENFISFLRSGTEVSEAARKAGISMKLVERLQSMGNRRSVPTLLEVNAVEAPFRCGSRESGIGKGIREHSLVRDSEAHSQLPSEAT
ncbi:MAG: hypothetical protein F6K23_40450 [Okeania sp. SIO2C9]|uniref:hypothetical protein n=1 Tax=Okeania sp. SIO2C9 TaxID=2607791 RepID=UPI0013C06C25|nr:hypothetical protein [Okeania sp. SIO2C9]NEQ78717.1 hypothetical protein [Okeania sp. SIO2C9]